MKSRATLFSTAAVSALALVTACSSSPSRRDDRVAEAPIVTAPVYGEYGQVTSIDVIPIAARPSGAGAILGAVVGGVVGNQFGAGAGRALATGAGVVGGAVAGNAIEGRQKHDDEVFRVGVRLDSGVQRYMDFHRIDDLRVGDRVRFDNGQLYRN
jgi:outer membrane lipoprotein SlyB